MILYMGNTECGSQLRLYLRGKISMKEHRKMYDPQEIKMALERSLGSETANLVLKTLKRVYKIDEQTMNSNPDLFEEKIRRMLGDSTAEIILKAFPKSED